MTNFRAQNKARRLDESILDGGPRAEKGKCRLPVERRGAVLERPDRQVPVPLGSNKKANSTQKQIYYYFPKKTHCS